MLSQEKPKIWVAVMVWRGFPDEVKGYLDESSADRQERLWRRSMNPDYDETGVFQLVIEENTTNEPVEKSE